MHTSEPLPASLYEQQGLSSESLRVRLAACALSVVVAFTGLNTPPVQALANDIKIELSNCPPPSEASLHAVTAMFDGPAPTPPVLDGETEHERSQRETAFHDQKTQELGIRMPVFSEHDLTTLEASLSHPDESKPFTDYMAVAKAILGQSGVPIVIGVPKSVQAEVPTQQELEVNDAKEQVLKLARMFSGVPINLTANMGIKGVALTAHGVRSKTFGAYGGLALTKEGILIVDVVNAGDNYEVAQHELYHLVATSLCRSKDLDISDDPGYAALNSAASYAGKWPLPPSFLTTQPKTYADVADASNALDADMLTTGEQDNMAAYCNSQKALAQLVDKVEMTSPYDYSEVAEDEADVGKEMFDPFHYSRMLNPETPILRKKFLYLLAKVYEKYPAVIDYYALIASRPAPERSCD